ncbi:hypothetical protein BOTBODRAFT_172547 [Botryobasidium botryosum FD-172 SS1]|uniref:Uncharacterized protein n=1 Tax=Botryobasidium botryosum (strain FD-172 SS1) TaxID=930990 RepID=A0A067MQF4_BOTB1|nr:hypothetical protein BOTBODRAFT_172547 [Botryobasidium botryosum FD-172 SS1]
MGQCSEAELSWGFIIPKKRLTRLVRCLRKHYSDKAKPESDSETEQEEQPRPAKRPRVEKAKDKEEKGDEDKDGDEDDEDNDDDDDDDDDDNYDDGDAEEGELEQYLWQVLNAEKYDGAFRLRRMGDDPEAFAGYTEYDEPESSKAILIAHTESRYTADRWGGTFGSCVTVIGKKLYNPEENQDLVRQLEVDLHLAEIGMKLPVTEQWLLAVNVG